MDKIYQKPNTIPKESINITLDNNFIGLLIGKDGKFFKKINKETDVDYIWYDNDDKKILIWGEDKKVLIAKEMLRKHIIKITNKTSESRTIIN